MSDFFEMAADTLEIAENRANYNYEIKRWRIFVKSRITPIYEFESAESLKNKRKIDIEKAISILKYKRIGETVGFVNSIEEYRQAQVFEDEDHEVIYKGSWSYIADIIKTEIWVFAYFNTKKEECIIPEQKFVVDGVEYIIPHTTLYK